MDRNYTYEETAYETAECRPPIRWVSDGFDVLTGAPQNRLQQLFLVKHYKGGHLLFSMEEWRDVPFTVPPIRRAVPK